MRVDPRCAVTREVLCAGGNSDPLEPLRERHHVTGDELWVVAERADPDHRVQGIRIDVCNRSELEIEPDPGKVAAHSTGNRAGELGVVDCAECVGAGVGAAPCELETRYITALLVQTDQQVRAFGAEPVRKATRRLLIADVAREEDDPAEPGGELTKDPVRCHETLEAREQACGRESFELGAHPYLTAPAVSPKTIRR